ncbi:MAG: Coenzyme F420 hydrogenase/dehydrogenase, beta subunit C-terminal domain [Clostridia bacterium]|nr:Coenzyme F420 hydrogenase/dehydrogenase, beta subunit C-terminal domain [Clostridia bacterium]
MKRIDSIVHLEQKCTGCMACVDACPVNCISSMVGKDGFLYSVIEDSKCVGCGKCYSVCPIETKKKHGEEQRLFAAYAKDSAKQNNGSSGGIFELLANHFLKQGYFVCGAALDNLTLKHRVVRGEEEIKPLLKSKYIQSNMEGIYEEILGLLEKGEKVFFCGTPCQVSALLNSASKAKRELLFTADIICHGVPSQKVFDEYIDTLKRKHGGEISDFSFRIKDNRYKHAHGYSYKVIKNGKTRVVNGIYTSSSFYNAFKKYLIFRNSCYDCRYATLDRVSDITLADFWGIEKYDFKGSVDAGVSMIVTNTKNGLDAFSALEEKIVYKEFPVQYGVDSNHCLTHTTRKPKKRDAIIEELAMNGYETTAKKYFGCGIIHRLYWWIPPSARTFIRKMRGK